MAIVFVKQLLELTLIIERRDVVVACEGFAMRLLERAQIFQHFLNVHRRLAALEEKRVFDILENFRLQLQQSFLAFACLRLPGIKAMIIDESLR